MLSSAHATKTYFDFHIPALSIKRCTSAKSGKEGIPPIFLQAIAAAVSQAANTVAQAQNLAVILNEEAAFYYHSGLDVTTQVIAELDKLFDAQKLQMAPPAAPELPNS